MIKSVLAVVAAAVCAGATVEFIPEPLPAVAAATAPAQSQGSSTPDSKKSPVVAAVQIAESHKATCSQGWPYYEPACLRDDRRSDRKIRVVRVIVTDRSVTDRTLQTQR